MRVRLPALAATVATLAPAAPAAAQTACDPTRTPPEFLSGVPTLSDIVPTPGGESGEDRPFARRLPSALQEAGVATIAFRAP